MQNPPTREHYQTMNNKSKVQLLLTAEEQQVLLGIIDLAVKHPASNLDNAKNAVILADKVKAAPVFDGSPKCDLPARPE